jgi:hypothetical protein
VQTTANTQKKKQAIDPLIFTITPSTSRGLDQIDIGLPIKIGQ